MFFLSFLFWDLCLSFLLPLLSTVVLTMAIQEKKKKNAERKEVMRLVSVPSLPLFPPGPNHRLALFSPSCKPIFSPV